MDDDRLIRLAVIALAVALLLSVAAGGLVAAAVTRLGRDARRPVARALAVPIVLVPGVVGAVLAGYAFVLVIVEFLLSALVSFFLLVAEAFGIGSGPRLIARGLLHASRVPACLGLGLLIVAGGALAVIVSTFGAPGRLRRR